MRRWPGKWDYFSVVQEEDMARYQALAKNLFSRVTVLYFFIFFGQSRNFQLRCAHQPRSYAHEHPLAKYHVYRQDAHNQTREVLIFVTRGNPVFRLWLRHTPCGHGTRGIGRRHGAVTDRRDKMAIFQQALIWVCGGSRLRLFFHPRWMPNTLGWTPQTT